jgi:hypothetical protein
VTDTSEASVSDSFNLTVQASVITGTESNEENARVPNLAFPILAALTPPNLYHGKKDARIPRISVDKP